MKKMSAPITKVRSGGGRRGEEPVRGKGGQVKDSSHFNCNWVSYKAKQQLDFTFLRNWETIGRTGKKGK